MKCPVSGAKTCIQDMTVHGFIVLVQYCCVFTTQLEIRITAVQNSNICGVSLKVNVLSCCKYPLHQTQPYKSNQKCYKNTFVDAAVLF